MSSIHSLRKADLVSLWLELEVAAEVVECHSGYTYAERPIALHWGGVRLPIAEILARWRISGGLRFRIRTEDDRVFELFYGELYDEWRVSQV